MTLVQEWAHRKHLKPLDGNSCSSKRSLEHPHQHYTAKPVAAKPRLTSKIARQLAVLFLPKDFIQQHTGCHRYI